MIIFPQDTLPPVLYLQMDNACRDNKNKYTLTFAALLVEMGIFRKVWVLSYLYYKGHVLIIVFN